MLGRHRDVLDRGLGNRRLVERGRGLLLGLGIAGLRVHGLELDILGLERRSRYPGYRRQDRRVVLRRSAGGRPLDGREPRQGRELGHAEIEHRLIGGRLPEGGLGQGGKEA